MATTGAIDPKRTLVSAWKQAWAAILYWQRTDANRAGD